MRRGGSRARSRARAESFPARERLRPAGAGTRPREGDHRTKRVPAGGAARPGRRRAEPSRPRSRVRETARDAGKRAGTAARRGRRDRRSRRKNFRRGIRFAEILRRRAQLPAPAHLAARAARGNGRSSQGRITVPTFHAQQERSVLRTTNPVFASPRRQT